MGGVTWVDNTGDLWLFGGFGVAKLTAGVQLNDLWKYSISANLWTWMGGDTVGSSYGVYGNLGVADIKNRPGSRFKPVSWKDNTGNFWLYGGVGRGQSGLGSGGLTDLWKYDVSTNLWTWMKGDSVISQSSVYGIKGIPADNNKPWGSLSGTTWVDNENNLWLFGNGKYLNELWKFNPALNQWTWIHGDSAISNQSVYGIKGVASTTNHPGLRQGYVSWIAKDGNLWLFGGFRYETKSGPSNDLWRYNFLTDSWAWVNGDTTIMQSGIYGTKGGFDTRNQPGGRQDVMGGWSDTSGNLYLMGGYGMDNDRLGDLCDLWKYNTVTNRWAWIKGDKVVIGKQADYNEYGTKGIADTINNPGARSEAAFWKDKSGNLWIYGGTGIGAINDMWQYSPNTNSWRWVSGDSVSGQGVAFFGVAGVKNSKNQPGSRKNSTLWTDTSGNFWLFGGYYKSGEMNDLWKYEVTSGQWTWVHGDTTIRQRGTYGSKGIAGSNNKPQARTNTVSWIDKSENLWLMGGYSASGYLNDLWKYEPVANKWTWIHGDSIANVAGRYGTVGTANILNKPGSRTSAASWVDSTGNLWLFGGFGMAASGFGRLSDLWKYNVITNEWTWVKGSSLANANGSYGSQNAPSSFSTPGSRTSPATWKDINNNLWLFGGYGNGFSSDAGPLSDLWRYSINSNQWTWISGNAGINSRGIYETKGVSNSINTPGSRYSSMFWNDDKGNFWLFGGQYFGGGVLNNLWKYTPTVSVLPLNILSFAGAIQNDDCILNWQTTNEINTSHFNIQRSTDGINFVNIGTVAAAGSGNNNYNFTDKQLPATTTVYYRLQSADKDGKSTLSNVVSVSLASQNIFFTLSPNPAKDIVYIQANDLSEVTVTDASGKIILKKSVSGNKAALNISAFTSGIYMVTVKDKNNNTATKKLVVQ